MRLAKLVVISIYRLLLSGKSTYTRVKRRKKLAGHIDRSLLRVIGDWHALDDVSGSLLELIQGQV
jgi:hypothetical protein